MWSRLQTLPPLFFLFTIVRCPLLSFFFFFNDTATTEIYTLSLHDALPISDDGQRVGPGGVTDFGARSFLGHHLLYVDRKSTRLNSSHLGISYAVFCLKKKKKLLPIERRALREKDLNERLKTEAQRISE